MPKEVDAITKLYDFILWIIPKLEKYPRSQKFLLADRTARAGSFQANVRVEKCRQTNAQNVELSLCDIADIIA